VTALVIDVPLAELPPSPNRSKGVHWAVGSRANKAARETAWAQAWVDRPHGARARNKRSVRIEIIYPASRKGPMTDPDSALARLKPLIDGLVDAGCLRGDGPADVVYAPVEQRKEGKQLLVRFTLADVSRGAA
jgi:hypothetical protein